MKSLVFYFVYLSLGLFILESDCYKNITNGIIKELKNGSIKIEIKNKSILLNILKNDTVLMQNVLLTNDSKIKNEEIYIKHNCEPATICISYLNVTFTKIKTNHDNQTISIIRTINDPNGQLTDCYPLASDTEWFGGPQQIHQLWPIQNTSYKEVPYLPTHSSSMSIAERYWLSSKGIYIFVDRDSPLFLDQNNIKDKHLCLIAKNYRPYRKRNAITLNYEIGIFEDPRKAHEFVIEKYFDKPTDYPSERMITHPVWSTWARDKIYVNEQTVKTLADAISNHGFNNSQIEIDDRWESCYGSLTFDSQKFPNITGLLSYLKSKKFRVTLWVHPFINLNCRSAFSVAKKNNYFVKNTNGITLTKWWQGVGGVIDFTNPEAVKWQVGRIKKLETLGFDSFKFDAGEVSWIPQIANLTGPLEMQPGIYTSNYTSNLVKYFDDSIEVRTGWKTQGLPVFVRMMDKDTTWTWKNGLPTLITTLFQMNLSGYVFVLPDMIGGNGYVNTLNSNVTKFPTKELFIRWLQANVFMPSMQFSFVPWDFDDEAISISKYYTELHAKISPKIIELMKKSMRTGAPINIPIWWVDPLNVQAHKINDEYLLGEEILVAPVITENSAARNIYLPSGKWKDANTGVIYTGPTWINNYHAPLHILPYFYKI